MPLKGDKLGVKVIATFAVCSRVFIDMLPLAMEVIFITVDSH